MKLIVPNKNYSVFDMNYGVFDMNSKNKVTNVLFQYPEKEFSLSDLAIVARVAKANIGAILSELETVGIIRIEKLSRIWRIKANQANQLFIRSKIIYNLGFIYKSGIIDVLADYFKNPKAIVLFGSFRKGEDISSSDIDIAVEQDRGEYETTKLNELMGFEKSIGKTIQIHLFSREDIDDNLFNNIANGILLWGFLEVKK